MNREAAALGVPAYTTFAGRLGAVDEKLIDQQRLRVLTSVESVQLEKRADTQRGVGRDPGHFLDLMLTALES